MEQRDSQGNTSVYASVDVGAEDARRWIADALTAQAERGEPGALVPTQREDLTKLLSGTWWEAVFQEREGATVDGTKALLERSLPPVIRAISALPGGGLVLALYLRNLVNAAWALTWDHTMLAAAIRISCTASATTPADDLSRLGWRLLEFILKEFRVETALLAGRVTAVTAAAEDAVATIEAIVAEVGHVPVDRQDAHLAEGLRVLEQEAHRELIYYRTVRDGARLAEQLFDGSSSRAGRELDRLRRVVADTPFHGVDASELRGHLTAISTVCDAQDEDRLHIDQGRVRFVFPFGVRSLDHATDAETTQSLTDALIDRRSHGGALGGLSITTINHRLDLSDVWQGTDNFDRGYRGATIEFGDIAISRPGTQERVQIVKARIQLSELGNNAIVFEIDLADTPAHRAAEIIHLASPSFGDVREIPDLLTIHSADGPLAGIPQVVEAIIEDLRPLVQDAAIAARSGSFGVITTILAASRNRAGVRTPLTACTEILGLWGTQSLIHPLPSGAASIADWTMYDVDTVQTWPLLHLNDELLASNSNVSLLASLGSPDFAIQDVESFLEFAHTMHGMYQGWQDTVRDYADQIATLLRKADRLRARAEAASAPDPTATIAELNELVQSVERTELSLQAFVQSNEAIMLFIESPSIVSSPPLRVDLDTVLLSNGYARLRDGFTRAIRDVLSTRLQPLLEVVHRRVQQAFQAEQALRERERLDREEEFERRQTERDRVNGHLLELLGTVFAVTGFAGLASVLQAGHPEWGAAEAWALFVGVVGLAALTGVVLALITSRRAKRDSSDGRRDEGR